MSLVNVQYKSLAFMGYSRYQVGNDGSLWSIHGDASRGIPYYWREVRGSFAVGYRRAKMPGSKSGVMVHQLVLSAFVGPCPDGMQCCHNNGNRADNRLTNLRWDTPKSNSADRHKHGTVPFGARSGRAKLTEKQVLRIRMEWKHRPWKSMRAFSKHHATKLGVSYHAIRGILLFPQKHWAHVVV